MSRYSRQTCLFDHGRADQDRLRAARVLVVGAGGLSASLLPLLIGAGCGAVTVMDGDVVEAHNLHRQTLFRESDIGASKAETVASRLKELNSECHIIPISTFWTPDHPHITLSQFDLVIDAADSVAATYGLSDRCKLASIAFLSASVTACHGHVGAFCRNAPSYRAVFPELPAHVMTCADTGVSGPIVSAIGALQAEMAIRILRNAEPSPLGLMFYLDAASWQGRTFRFDTAPEPEPPAPPFIGLSELRDSDRILVLNRADLSVSKDLPAPMHIDLKALDKLPTPPASVQRSVFVCRRGVSAWKAANDYRMRTGDNNVALIAAG